MMPGRVAELPTVELRQQVEQCQAQQVGAGKRIEQPDVPRVIQPEPEHGDGPEPNARQQDQVIHNSCGSVLQPAGTAVRRPGSIANRLQLRTEENPTPDGCGVTPTSSAAFGARA